MARRHEGGKHAPTHEPKHGHVPHLAVPYERTSKKFKHKPHGEGRNRAQPGFHEWPIQKGGNEARVEHEGLHGYGHSRHRSHRDPDNDGD